MNRAAAIVALVLWTLATFWVGWEWRDRSADLKKLRADLELAELVNDTLVEAIDAERAKARALADIGTQHEEDRRDAETVPAAVAADLRDGNLRLRREWAGCETQRLSEASAASIERDAATERRAEFAAAVVRVGAEADSQLAACQAVVLTYAGQ